MTRTGSDSDADADLAIGDEGAVPVVQAHGGESGEENLALALPARNPPPLSHRCMASSEAM